MSDLEDWQSLAKAKRNSINNSIPLEWRLTSVPSAEEQRDVTGEFIRRSLSEEEIAITETEAPGILSNLAKGQWKAEAVVKAFCHRASTAHQLVSFSYQYYRLKHQIHINSDQLLP